MGGGVSGPPSAGTTTVTLHTPWSPFSHVEASYRSCLSSGGASSGYIKVMSFILTVMSSNGATKKQTLAQPSLQANKPGSHSLPPKSTVVGTQAPKATIQPGFPGRSQRKLGLKWSENPVGSRLLRSGFPYLCPKEFITHLILISTFFGEF